MTCNIFLTLVNAAAHRTVKTITPFFSPISGMEEIRHVLICMGEMITEEEIDTMISMIDKDGDGQVGSSNLVWCLPRY